MAINVRESSVSAVIVTDHGRLLMQLRDTGKPIVFPGHWGLFGGHVESGENDEDAMRRELREEIAFRPPSLQSVACCLHELEGLDGSYWVRESFFFTTMREVDFSELRLMEGADFKFWEPDKILANPRIVPLHAAAIIATLQKYTDRR